MERSPKPQTQAPEPPEWLIEGCQRINEILLPIQNTLIDGITNWAKLNEPVFRAANEALRHMGETD